MRSTLTLSLALVVLAGAACRERGEPPAGYRVPPALDDGWETAPAESVGLDPARLAALTASLQAWPELGVHAILIERSGRLAYEQYFDGFDQRWGEQLGYVAMGPETIHDLRSVTKSVVSALAGIAVAEGAMESLDQPVVEWFPEYPELDAADRRRVTLAHVLGMTSGLEWNEDVPYTNPANDEIRMTNDPEPLRYALSRAFVDEPGAQFNYNGGLTQVMAAVIERATETPIEEYVRTRLFEPLGIDTFEWVGDLAGMPAAASGLRLARATSPSSGRCTSTVVCGRAPKSYRSSGSSDRRAGASASMGSRGVTGARGRPEGGSSDTRTFGGTPAFLPTVGRLRRAPPSVTVNSGWSSCRGSIWS